VTSLASAPPASPAATPTVARLLSRFGLPAGGIIPPWLGRARRAALEWATGRGFPTRKDEDWRYTPLGPLLGVPFERSKAAAGRRVSPAAIDRSSSDASIARLTFVNGFFAPHLSSLTGLPAGVTVTNLAAALAAGGGGLETFFCPVPGENGHAFDGINTALAEDGAVIRVAPGTLVDGLIELLFYADGDGIPVMANPRSMIVAGEGSRLTVVETYIGPVGSPTCTNAVTQVVVARGATVQHYKVQDEPDTGFHLGLLDVRQGPVSRFSSLSLALGSRMARHQVRVRLEGEGAHTTVNGLYLPDGDRHHDNPVLVVHAAPRCTSRQLYKGIAADRGHGVFNGRIVVLPAAPGTDASQTNQNLLLSDHAEIDTRPRLEILTDDVKCTHGATVGALDPDAIFYLRSRGVPLEQAKVMLTAAFAGQMLDTIAPDPLRTHLETLVAAHLTTSPTPDRSSPGPGLAPVGDTLSNANSPRTGRP
jgi:Fe-S cluster assembly protein SufD